MFSTKLSFPLTQTAQGKCKERWTPFMELVLGGSVGMALFHPCAQKKDFNCWVCVCLLCLCHHRSAECFIAIACEHLPAVVSRAITCPGCGPCSLILPSGKKQGDVCLAAVLLDFPSPNLYVIHNLHIMEGSLYSRWCTPYLRSSKSCYTEDKVMLCWRTYQT